jgi:2-polyprenyl-6-methoxyphenol hydroxylase-like FAD-dependent oxidoreductase
MTVLIAGGGIGGLTLALSLHQIGIPCRVFESVSELKPLGVGINVLPHAVRELIELGLLEQLNAFGVRTKELSFFSKHGKPIWTEPRGLEAGYKWPQFSIHRGVLQQILLDAVIERRTMIMAGHEILKFVCYPISNTPFRNGKYQINWVAERHLPPDYKWRREDYNRSANLDDFLPWFEDWRFDWLDVPGLIRECPHSYEYPLVDRDPVDRWTFGNVTLMGDAAHPMYPIGSNGASQAILDARVITREILNHGETSAALNAYEAERRPATTDLVMLNRRNGPEQVMQMVEERAPDGFEVVTDVLSQHELEDIAANYKRVAGFQVEALNAKPAIVTMPHAAVMSSAG